MNFGDGNHRGAIDLTRGVIGGLIGLLMLSLSLPKSKNRKSKGMPTFGQATVARVEIARWFESEGSNIGGQKQFQIER